VRSEVSDSGKNRSAGHPTLYVSIEFTETKKGEVPDYSGNILLYKLVLVGEGKDFKKFVKK
jgi:hypothetical protein